jgi:hypothetical protein
MINEPFHARIFEVGVQLGAMRWTLPSKEYRNWVEPAIQHMHAYIDEVRILFCYIYANFSNVMNDDDA